MTVDDLLTIIENRVLQRQLSPVERIVLRQTWDNQTYEQMSQQSGYGDAHLKDTGYRLWREISDTIGQRVTKKSFSFVLQQHLQLDPASTPSLVTGDQTERSHPHLPHYPSGPLPLTSHLYIERPPWETLSYAEVERPGGLLRIKAAQKTGKTSLLFRVMDYGLRQGYQIAYLDLQSVDMAVFADLETFLRWFCLRVGQELNLTSKLDDYWNPQFGHKVSSELYCQEYFLEQCQTPLLLVISAIERLLDYPNIAQEFFPLLRSWHEKGKWNSVWKKLRLVITYSTEIYMPLNIYQSPFNIGQTIKLPCFTSEQVQDLAHRYGLDWIEETRSQRLMGLVGGHPFLTNVAFYHLATKTLDFETLIQTAATPTGIYGDYLRDYLPLLQRHSELADMLKQVMSSEDGISLNAVTMHQLESLGLVKAKGDRVFPSCEVYRSYFLQQLSF
jgi:hypothetical protein